MITSFIALMMYIQWINVHMEMHPRYIDYVLREHALRRWWIGFLSIYTVILRRHVVRLSRQIHPMF